ncbi:hypothetical protein FRB99_006227 [Tulasnella sp. 403]|nr:hypothetical protein FRB99_006227 [Tulasnella sp. 403]
MDLTTACDDDFAFAFKQRSASPNPFDCLAPSSLHCPAPSFGGSQSPPSSLSDDTSQDSHESPRGWSSTWSQTLSSAVGSLPPDDSWPWSQVIDYKAPDCQAVPLDLSAINVEDTNMIPSHLPHQGPSALVNVATMDLFGFQFFQPFPQSTHNQSTTSPVVGSATTTSSMEDTGVIAPSTTPTIPGSDYGLVVGAIESAGTHIATLQSTIDEVASLAAQAKHPAPRMSKPDLASCPPLAKHIQSGAAVPSASPTIHPDLPQDVILGPSGRPKTSHTTIERRYRTNLNARILSLRHAVPALRILEKDENNNPRFPDDVMDERGYVDGVRAARKASKASILGKAAEYIHVLKKRELRLRHEAAGLRMLINSLVGGPSLLKEFDKSWKRQYGGEEMDEMGDGSDCDDGDDDCSDEDDDRPKKRLKPSRVAPPKKEKKVDQSPDQGKRKRGRPKKSAVPTPAEPAAAPNVLAAEPAPSVVQPQVSQAGGVQYLLGAFLFFSFFRPSPTTSPSFATEGNVLTHTHHSHPGTVVVPRKALDTLIPLAAVPGYWNFFSRHSEVIFAAMILALVIIPNVSLLKRSILSLRPFAERQNVCQVDEGRSSSGTKGIDMDATQSYGFMCKSIRPDASDKNLREWTRLATLELLTSISRSTRPRLCFLTAFYRNVQSSTHASLILSLLLYPWSPMMASRLWSAAQHHLSSSSVSQNTELLVTRLSTAEAYALLDRAIKNNLIANLNAIETVADVIVLEALKDIAKEVFLETASCDGVWTVPHPSGAALQAVELLRNVGGQLDGRSRAMLQMWDMMQEGILIEPAGAGSGILADTVALIRATFLLRQLALSWSESRSPICPRSAFAGAGKKSKNTSAIALKLRQTLASEVFASDDALEDAKDAVVDVLYSHTDD